MVHGLQVIIQRQGVIRSIWLTTCALSPFVDTRRGAMGAKHARTSGQRLRLPIPLPPLPEQRAIAHVLSTVQRAREATEAVIAATRELKRSLMRHLFTYGPVPVDRVDEVRLKETEIGMVPEEWQTATLGQIAAVSSGGTPDRSRPEFWDGGIPWIKTGEVHYNEIRSSGETISEEGLRCSSARVYPAGTILMAMYGQGVTRGRVAILGIDAAINQACLGITPRPGVTADFLFHFLTYRYEAIRDMGHGAHQKNLNAGMIKALVVPVPSVVQQVAIASFLSAADTKLGAAIRQERALAVALSALLEQLVSGTARVRETA